MYLNLSDKLNKILIISIKALLFFTALTPLIVTWSTAFPYIFGKIVFFRSAVEIALILFLIYFFLNYRRISGEIRENFKKLFKNPLFIFTGLFILALIISTIFAVNSYRAFWGTIDRGEGLFGILHIFVLLIMALSIFNKKDWLIFFKIYLISSLILIFYSFLQYFKVYNFPFALKFINPRPGSFIGNPAFLAVHLIFTLIFAVIVFSEKTRINTDEQQINADNPYKSAKIRTNQCLNNFWRYFSLIIILLSVAAIFLTGTRGAILGLGAGFIFLLFYLTFRKKGLWRRLAIGFFIFLIILGGIFWLTRHQPIWQKIPGFNRLSQTAFLNINDPSTQTRLITWKLSWEAFKEKPLFGWGPENYLMAYEKYYDPDFAVYGETWLDRAHNKIFDLLVMQGLFGLLIYLGIFASAFYLLFKKRIAGKPFIMAGLIAYFVQNLVLFDQFNSDIAFFVLLGFLIHSTIPGIDSESAGGLILQSSDAKTLEPLAEESEARNKKSGLPSTKALFVIAPLMVIAVGFLGYSVYAYNYVPFSQSREFQKYPNYGNVESAVKSFKKSLYPYNFAQYNIRGSRMDEFYLDKFFYNPDYIKNPKLRPIADLLIEAMDELSRREPFDVRVLLREVEMINGLTKIISDEKESALLFKKAEELMREAVKRAPNRQEVYYHLAFNLAGQKRYDESIEAAQYAVSLNPKIIRAHYHLALMFMLAGKNEEAEKELNIIESISPDLDLRLGGLLKGDLNTVMLFYSNQGKAEKIAKLIIKSFEGTFRYPRQYYEKSLGYFADKKDLPHFLEVADYLATFDDLKEDMETFMDFVKSGDWDVEYVYNGEGRADKIAGLLIKSFDEKITRHKFQRQHYETFLGYFIHNEDSAHSLQVADYLANFSDLKDNMEVIVDLIKKGNWTIIHNTLGI